MVMTAAYGPDGISVSDLDRCAKRSSPRSRMNSTARGLITPDGRDPALNASMASPPRARANASAIWLRFEFSTQTNRTLGRGIRFQRETHARRRLRARFTKLAGRLDLGGR